LLWNYDSDKDGHLADTEAEAITKIELSTDNISTLEGIQGFPNLNYLHAQGTRKDEKNYGKLTQVDLTGNPKLRHIHLIHNHISKLVLGDQPDLDYLGLDYNDLTEIDVKSFAKLTLLQVSYNKLKTIDVSGLNELDEFHCADNPIETITLSNPKLVSFRCAGTLIKELDLSKCPKLNYLDCADCPNLTIIKLAKGQVIGNITKDDKTKFEYYE
jgi:Leucine-rich repeat (LRR) protein